MHLLPVGRVEPGTGEPEVRPRVVLHEPDRLGVERDGPRYVGDVDGDVVDADGLHLVAHESEPTTCRTIAATAGAAAAPTAAIAARSLNGGSAPAAGLVTSARPRTSTPPARAAIVSSATDMPTTSAPIVLSIRISAGVSNWGPASCA